MKPKPKNSRGTKGTVLKVLNDLSSCMPNLRDETQKLSARGEF